MSDSFSFSATTNPGILSQEFLPYVPRNIEVSESSSYTNSTTKEVTYTQKGNVMFADIRIQVKPQPPPRSSQESEEEDELTMDMDSFIPGQNCEHHTVDGYHFPDHNFSTALENKDCGFVAFAPDTMLDISMIDFEDFDIVDGLKQLVSSKPVHKRESDNDIESSTPVKKRKSSTTTFKSDPVKQEATDTVVHAEESRSEQCKNRPHLKCFVFGIAYNLLGKTFPSDVQKLGTDMSWLVEEHTTESSNLHLVLKMLEWKHAYERFSEYGKEKHSLPKESTKHQDIFANVMVPRAISAIASCKLPVWLMSDERMIEIIEGIDDVSVAGLVVNLSSHAQFGMNCHISSTNIVVYIETIHYDHIFVQNKAYITGSETKSVFYGVDENTHR